MAKVRLKIDVSGTVGDEAWRQLRQFDEIQSAAFGPQFGCGGGCKHPATAPHAKGEWIGAEIRLQTPLLAQYAVSHYLEQDRVLDADVVELKSQPQRRRGTQRNQSRFARVFAKERKSSPQRTRRYSEG